MKIVDYLLFLINYLNSDPIKTFASAESEGTFIFSLDVIVGELWLLICEELPFSTAYHFNRLLFQRMDNLSKLVFMSKRKGFRPCQKLFNEVLLTLRRTFWIALT